MHKLGSFSKKINGGYFCPHGEFVLVPTGICRFNRRRIARSGGWQIAVSVDGITTKALVSDNNHNGDYRASLDAAVLVLRKLKKTPILTSKHYVKTQESRSKRVVTGVPGVCVVKFLGSNGKLYYRFNISIGRGVHTSVGIGPEAKYEQCFDAALAKAKQVREKLVEQHRTENSFTAV